MQVGNNRYSFTNLGESVDLREDIIIMLSYKDLLLNIVIIYCNYFWVVKFYMYHVMIFEEVLDFILSRYLGSFRFYSYWF